MSQDFTALNLLLGGAKSSSTHKNLIVLAFPKNPLSQLLLLIRILRQDKNPKSLVIGDNDISLLIGWVASRFAQNIKIQISIHASLEQILTSSGTLNRVRKLLLFWSFNRVHSIRMVSATDSREISTLLPVPPPEIVFAPIPIMIPKDEPAGITKKQVAFIGRIHPERGIHELLDILRMISEGKAEYNFLIVGDGLELDWLRKEASSLTGLNIEFRGRLEHAEVQKLWSEIKVLVSCAKTESYGLTLREALLNGSLVVARANSTTCEIESKFPKLLKTYTTLQEAVLQIEEFISCDFELNQIKDYRGQIESEQEVFLKNLAISWVS
jgi:glycosyltransferase involved in cell wall biosynthesis